MSPKPNWVKKKRREKTKNLRSKRARAYAIEKLGSKPIRRKAS